MDPEVFLNAILAVAAHPDRGAARRAADLLVRLAERRAAEEGEGGEGGEENDAAAPVAEAVGVVGSSDLSSVSLQVTGRGGRRRLEEDALPEACVPNKTGGRHHDDETGHPCSPGGGGGAGKGAGRQGASGPPAPHPARFDPRRVESGDRRHLASWDFYDDEGDAFEQDVYVREGEYDPDPGDPDAEPITVYRWESYQGGDLIVAGGWTADEGEAEEGGEGYARDNHQGPPGDEEGDDEEGEGEGEGNGEGEEDGGGEGGPGRGDPDDPGELSPFPTPKKSRFDKTPADVVTSLKGADDRRADRLVGRLFPAGDVGDAYNALALCTGAPADAEVDVVYAGRYEPLFGDDLPMDAEGVRVEVRHPKFGRFVRFVGVDSAGRKFIRNEIVEVKEAYRKEGLGSAVFGKQVESAVEHGFDYIRTHAAGGPGEEMNGYYTWPRFGYDQTLASLRRTNPEAARRVEGAFPGARSVRDVMATPEGRAWWKDNGGDLHDARFDLREGSWSRHILDKYLDEREGRGARRG